ncbi:MAG: helix-turn-helix domain-containing protein [Chloroflexi bacterium]|nr:helix-turn-helix domain-containing protein [Chloroflexota bacterium]
MTLGQRVRELREELGMSQTDLAKAANLSPSYIGHIESGRREPSKPVIRGSYYQFETTPHDLLKAAGYLVPGPEVPRARRPLIRHVEQAFRQLEYLARASNLILAPIRGHVPAGELSPETEQPEDYLPIPYGWAKGASRPYILIVNGDSMAGDMETGDMVLVDPDRQWENGKIVVVRVEHEVTVKRIYKTNGMVRLEPTNKKFKAIKIKEQNVEVLGVVIKKIRAEDV